MRPEKIEKIPRQTRMWGVESCPSCNSTNISTDHSNGDLVCQKCGLVLY